MNSPLYDIAIIGAGPAGMTAAIYALRANKSIIIIEKDNVGGQLSRSTLIENYPGVKSQRGFDLALSMNDQIESLGGEVIYDEVLSINKLTDGNFTIICNDDIYASKTVIVATGVFPNKLNLADEEKITNSIHYCVTCDGPFYKNKVVTVVGDGNSAAQYALELSQYCLQVNLLSNANKLFVEARMAEIIKNSPNIHVYYNTVIDKYWISSQNELQGLYVHNSETNDYDIIASAGVFVAIGSKPVILNINADTELNRDNIGRIMAQEDCLTSVKGIFAAGDCRTKNIHQVVSATCDGAMATLQAIKYLEK